MLKRLHPSHQLFVKVGKEIIRVPVSVLLGQSAEERIRQRAIRLLFTSRAEEDQESHSQTYSRPSRYSYLIRLSKVFRTYPEVLFGLWWWSDPPLCRERRETHTKPRLNYFSAPGHSWRGRSWRRLRRVTQERRVKKSWRRSARRIIKHLVTQVHTVPGVV